MQKVNMPYSFTQSSGQQTQPLISRELWLRSCTDVRCQMSQGYTCLPGRTKRFYYNISEEQRSTCNCSFPEIRSRNKFFFWNLEQEQVPRFSKWAKARTCFKIRNHDKLCLIITSLRHFQILFDTERKKISSSKFSIPYKSPVRNFTVFRFFFLAHYNGIVSNFHNSIISEGVGAEEREWDFVGLVLTTVFKKKIRYWSLKPFTKPPRQNKLW